MSYPPGFKFVPTDEELIYHYLKPFVEGNENPYYNVPIHHVDIYQSNPDQLTREYGKANDKDWFFITQRTKIRVGGKLFNRCDKEGFWKSVHVATKIDAGQGVIGSKALLDYHVRKPRDRVKSDWLMHEYLFQCNGDNSNSKVDHALCKLFMTPKVQKRKAEEEKSKRGKKRKKEKGEEEHTDLIAEDFDLISYEDSWRQPDLHDLPASSEYSSGLTKMMNLSGDKTQQPMSGSQTTTHEQNSGELPQDKGIVSDATVEQTELLSTSHDVLKNSKESAPMSGDEEFNSPVQVTPLFRSQAAGIPSPLFSGREMSFLLKTFGVESLSPYPSANPSQPPPCKRVLLDSL